MRLGRCGRGASQRRGAQSGTYSLFAFEALRRRFEQGRKYTEAQQLRGAINTKLQRMARLNKAGTDYLERFQRLIEEYNAGSTRRLHDNRGLAITA
jgi:hypothetical protein